MVATPVERPGPRGRRTRRRCWPTTARSAETRSITVRTVVGEQYPRIIGYELEDRPAWREPGMDDDLEPAGVLAGGSARTYDPG